MTSVKIAAAPSIRRLPSYLHVIKKARGTGARLISGTVIAQELNLEPIQVRKDLSITGIIGKPKKGYVIEELLAAIERFLGWDKPRPTIIVGMGNLGNALMGYKEFPSHGLVFKGAFDRDAAKTGNIVSGLPIRGLYELESFIASNKITTAVLSVPSREAQETAERLVEAGIRAIWNFTNVKLKLRPEVIVQREDLTSGWAVLCATIIKAESSTEPQAE